MEAESVSRKHVPATKASYRRKRTASVAKHGPRLPQRKTTKHLAARLQTLTEKQQQAFDELFNEFELVDPELAHQAIDVLEGHANAAQWLETEHLLLKGMSPYAAIGAGQRSEVLRILASMEYGIPV